MSFSKYRIGRTESLHTVLSTGYVLGRRLFTDQYVVQYVDCLIALCRAHLFGL